MCEGSWKSGFGFTWHYHWRKGLKNARGKRKSARSAVRTKRRKPEDGSQLNMNTILHS